MLSVKELKTLIKAHNKLSQIKIPPKAKAEDLVKLIEDNGYKVDHDKKELKPGVKRGKKITLKQAEEITKPKPKSDLQKQKEKELKEEKATIEKKKIREAKKEAVDKFKEGQKKKDSKKPVKKPMKKEDEVRPKEKVGRPRIDPKKIKVIESKKKEESKKESVIDSKSFTASKLKKNDLIKLIDSLGLDSRFKKRLQMIGSYRDFLKSVVEGGDFSASDLKPEITKEEINKLPFHIQSLYGYSNKGKHKLIEENKNVSKKELVSKIKKFFNQKQLSAK